MARKNTGDCIGVKRIIFSSTSVPAVQLIPANVMASRVIIQVYTNTAGVNAITPAVMAYQPIVVITEDGTDPVGDFDGVAGFGLFHMAMYEVQGQFNIQNTKLIAFAPGYTVYCKISYYK